MSDKVFFITTPIYYINGTPTVGHAYTQMAADARARFERSRGRRVYFLTGTDENALKVSRVARERGLEPQVYADEMAQRFRDVWDQLGISYDDYIRTTEPRHTVVVQRVIEKLWQNGHLALGTYSGWYSVPDETFFRDEETVERDGQHYLLNPSEDQTKEPLEWVEETVHFFTLSKFQDELLARYAAHPEMLQPESRRNETLSFIGMGLRDTSISRVQDWGIPLPSSVPESAGHVAYVWFPDALLNYASAPGYLSDDPEQRAFFNEAWPPDLHLMSKDIFTRFHTTLWPALLLALDLPLPRQCFAHGFWTVDGRKMSKRDPDTIIEPVAFAREIAERASCEFTTAVDALRYYCLREVTFGADGDFSREGCLARYNSDLANGLGNLVNRALSMLAQYFDGVVPDVTGDATSAAGESSTGKIGLRDAAAEALPRVEAAYETLDFSSALGAVWEIIALANRTIEEQKPWVKIKAGDAAGVAALLNELLAVCGWCAVTLAPVMPHVTQRLLDLLGVENTLSWREATSFALPAGHCCRAPQPLFPRIQQTKPSQSGTPLKKGNTMNETSGSPEANSPDGAHHSNTAKTNEMVAEANITNVRTDAGAAQTSVATSSEAAEVSATTDSAGGAAPAKATIEYADFAKVELRAAKIVSAERIPKADKLLKLQVDLGSEQRQILAGIAQQFEPESLIGKTIVVVANLAPRTMRGLESQGMLLAASSEADGPPSGLLTIDANVPPGSIIR